MERMLFCRVGWMEYYQGNLEEDPIFGGGSHVDRYGYGHEIYNFLPDDEGDLFTDLLKLVGKCLYGGWEPNSMRIP